MYFRVVELKTMTMFASVDITCISSLSGNGIIDWGFKFVLNQLKDENKKQSENIGRLFKDIGELESQKDKMPKEIEDAINIRLTDKNGLPIYRTIKDCNSKSENCKSSFKETLDANTKAVSRLAQIVTDDSKINAKLAQKMEDHLNESEGKGLEDKLDELINAISK